jgi:WD40 repeat protein
MTTDDVHHRQTSGPLNGGKPVHVPPAQRQRDTVAHGRWLLCSALGQAEAWEPAPPLLVDDHAVSAVPLRPCSEDSNVDDDGFRYGPPRRSPLPNATTRMTRGTDHDVLAVFRGLGGTGCARAVVVATASAFGAIAALGDRVRAPGWLRVACAAVAALGTIVAVVLTLGEQTEAGRQRLRRTRRWIDEHFEPRGRGIGRRSESGDFFTGRVAARKELVEWLSAAGEGGLCVLTGGPGSGKSAVIGRLVAQSNPKGRKALDLANDPPGTVLAAGSIDSAIHAKGLSLEEVVEAVGAAVGVQTRKADDLIAAIETRFILVVDALDEAEGDGEARKIAQRFLKPLADAGAQAGVRVLVGTRPGTEEELLRALGATSRVINLDRDEYFDRDDLVAYVRRRLLRDDDVQAPTPYRGQRRLAQSVAEAVAARAGRSFLIARLVSRSLEQQDRVVDVSQSGWELSFPATVADAMEDYLDRFPSEQDRRRARDLLSALSYAEGTGFPFDPDEDLWSPVAGALAQRRYGREDVVWLLGTAAADLIIATYGEQVTYRLFHEALVEHLRTVGEQRVVAQRRIVGVLQRFAEPSRQPERMEWSHSPAYLRQHLATHAAAAGQLHDVLKDHGYLLFADWDRLRRALRAVTRPDVALIKRVLDELPVMFGDSVGDRASHLELIARTLGANELADEIAELAPERPWSTRWVWWNQEPMSEPAPTGGVAPSRPRDWGRFVSAVAFSHVHRSALAISGHWDGSLRLWDLGTGEAVGEPLRGHHHRVEGLAVTELDGRSIAVSGSWDGTLRVWDLATGEALGEPLRGHEEIVHRVAVTHLNGRPIAVSGGGETLRVWDLVTLEAHGEPLRHGNDELVSAVAVTHLNGRPIAVSGGGETLRVWDLVTLEAHGEPLRHGNDELVSAVAVTHLDGRPIAVSGGETLRVWDLASGEALSEPLGDEIMFPVLGVAAGELDGRLIAIAGDMGGRLSVWDLRTAARVLTITPHASIFSVALRARNLLVGANGGLALIEWLHPFWNA